MFFAFVSVTLNIFKDRNEIISMMVMLAALPVLIGIFMIYYKNVSYVIIRKLLKESKIECPYCRNKRKLIIQNNDLFNLIFFEL